MLFSYLFVSRSDSVILLQGFVVKTDVSSQMLQTETQQNKTKQHKVKKNTFYAFSNANININFCVLFKVHFCSLL